MSSTESLGAKDTSACPPGVETLGDSGSCGLAPAFIKRLELSCVSASPERLTYPHYPRRKKFGDGVLARHQNGEQRWGALGGGMPTLGLGGRPRGELVAEPELPGMCGVLGRCRAGGPSVAVASVSPFTRKRALLSLSGKPRGAGTCSSQTGERVTWLGSVLPQPTASGPPGLWLLGLSLLIREMDNESPCVNCCSCHPTAPGAAWRHPSL